MDINNFFNQIDQTARSKEIEQNAKEAKNRAFTETTINFAQKIIEIIEAYIPEFEKRGFRCQNKTGNLPYWCFIVSSSNGNTVKVAIVNGHQNEYEIAFYNQDQRLNCPLYISDHFDKEKVVLELQDLFKKLV